jgi:hypothetical protein
LIRRNIRLEVKATDEYGNNSTVEILVIAVIDITPPEIYTERFFNINENPEDLLIGICETEEGCTMEMSGDDVGPLIFNNKRLTFAYTPDYENPKDRI